MDKIGYVSVVIEKNGREIVMEGWLGAILNGNEFALAPVVNYEDVVGAIAIEWSTLVSITPAYPPVKWEPAVVSISNYAEKPIT